MTASQLFQLMALLTGLSVFTRVAPFFVRLLIMLVAVTVLNELVVVPYVKATHLFNRNIAYNVFSLIDMAVWYYVLACILTNRTAVNWLKLFALITFMWSAAELYNNGWNVFHANSLRFYGVSMIVFSIYYLFTLIKKEYHPIFTDVNFWLCSAVIIYHSVLFLTITTLVENNYWNLKDAENVFVIFLNINNAIYYSLLCAAFVSAYYKHRKQHSQPELLP